VGTASAAQDGATASVLELGYCVSRTWSSSHSPPSISVSPNIKASLHELFVWLESTFTPRLVSNVLGAMSIAKAGLSRAEIIDIASTDDALLRDLFKWAVPPFARVPPSAVANVLHAVDSLVEERALHKCAPVLQWTNSSYRWHCKTRYDSTGLRRRMYQYFSGSASCQFKPLSVTCQDFSVMLSVDRQIADMPNIISLGNSKHRINQRKLTEIVPLMEGLNKWDDMTSFFCDMQVFDSLCSPAHITVYAAGWKSIISKHGEKGPEVIWEGLRSTVEKIDDYKERSALAHRIANFANVELGMPELSLRFLETSLHALVHQGSEDLEIANILEEIARIQYKAGEMESAISKLDEVLAIRSNEYLPDHQKLTGPLTLQGEIFLKSGKTEEAMKRYNEVLRRLRGLERSECRLVVADITTRVAEIYKNLDERDRAIACHEEALRIRKAVLDPDHLEVAINVSALAILYERRGDLANALSRFAEALQIRRSRLGPCHIDVASLYNNMAVVYERLGKLPEATKKYELALGVFRTKLGKNHMVVGTIYNNLGNVYKMQGAFAKAVESYQASLIIRRKALGKSLLVADTLNSLAGVHLLRGEFDRSLECCEESKLIREDLCGKDHVDVATMLNNIAGVLLKKGECDDSVEKLCTDAYKIKVEAYGEDHVQVAEILNNIAMLKDLRGEKDKALEITQEALKIQEALVGKNHISTAQTLHCKALFLRRNGDLDASAAICKEAIKARKALLGTFLFVCSYTASFHALMNLLHLPPPNYAFPPSPGLERLNVRADLDSHLCLANR
jgi:tetratricopeptide (TPR) repeat protein